jgi:murein endopeptidase
MYDDRNPDHRFGRESTIQWIQEVGDQWATIYPDGPAIRVTAISARGGGKIAGHKSHQTGVDIDIGVMRADGLAVGTTISDPTYSRPLTQHLVTRMHATGRVANVLFNDPVIRGVSFYKGHHNHLHVRLM